MKRKQLLLALGAILVAVAFVLVGPMVFSTNANTNSQTNVNSNAAVQATTAKLTITHGSDVKSYSATPTEGVNAMDFTKSLAEKEGITLSIKSYSFGDIIEGINGVSSDGEKFWSLYTNNELSSVGASQYIVKAGDVIEWRFQKL